MEYWPVAEKDWTVVPGRTLLEEVRLLELTGLTPQDARRAASTNIIEWIEQRP